MPRPLRVEYASQRQTRTHNKIAYRFAHWPIWIWVFFLAPGPLTFDLFAHGPSYKNGAWFALVLIGTGIAGIFGQLPGVEPRPYILRFSEDKPNPLYRRVCYTFAWNALLNFALLNFLGLAVAAATGSWVLKQIYGYGYFVLLGAVLCLGIAGLLPRVGLSTRHEGTERRYFYSTVWAVTISQTVLLVLWKVLPRTHSADVLKLLSYLFVLLVAGVIAAFGLLPRTRPILPGELIVAD